MDSVTILTGISTCCASGPAFVCTSELSKPFYCLYSKYYTRHRASVAADDEKKKKAREDRHEVDAEYRER
jgi:hypothetical protein